MSAQLAPSPVFQGLGFGGLPLPGGKLFTYVAGTTTPQATYTDNAQLTQNTNPVILNANGQANVWLNPVQAYKFVLQDLFGNLVWSVDQINAPALTQAVIGTILYPQTAAEAAAGVVPTFYFYPELNPLRYGADPTGVADSAAASQAALNVALQKNGAITYPVGQYKHLSGVIGTLASAVASLSLFGSGAEATQLIWPSGGGYKINYVGPFNSTHVRDLSFLTGTTGTGTQRGLWLNQTAAAIANPALTALSDVTNCVFRGSDGYGQTFYWQSGLYVASVSNINVTNCVCSGANAPALGIGMSFVGIPAVIGVSYNISGCTFLTLAAGLEYLSNVQGVTVAQSNFTGSLTGILVPSPATNCNQLSVTASQFACPGQGILTQAYIPNVNISGNTFFVGLTANNTGVELGNAGLFAITGNTFSAPNALNLTTNRGVSIDSTNASLPGTITDNDFQSMSIGVNLGATATTITVEGNALISCILPLNNQPNINPTVTNYISGNVGYNPVGILGPGGVGASPATITNGASPATFYFAQAGTFTATVSLGGHVIGTMTSGNVVVWDAGPNEQCVVTWTTTAPTFIQSVH
jgi:hypothetical protein